MKKIALLLGIMGAAVWILLSADDKKSLKNEGEIVKKKIRKTHFPAKEIVQGD